MWKNFRTWFSKPFPRSSPHKPGADEPKELILANEANSNHPGSWRAILSGHHFKAKQALTAEQDWDNEHSISLTDHPYNSLWQLKQHRQILEVKVAGTNQSHQTLVVALDAKRKILWLDELFPTHALLDIGDQIQIRHHKGGEQLSFSSPIIAWGSSFGASGMAVLLPESVRYQPRRQHLRAEVKAATNTDVRIRPIGHEMMFGTLEDISVGGLRMSIAGNQLKYLRHHALLPVCEFYLANNEIFRCTARIRAFRLLREPQRATQVSIEFVGVSSEQQIQLLEFINQQMYSSFANTRNDNSDVGVANGWFDSDSTPDTDRS